MDFQKLDIKINKLFENSGIPALSVIITDKDQNIYEKYLGFQNIENAFPTFRSVGVFTNTFRCRF